MAANDIYRVWSVDFPISGEIASPCDRLYRPYILTSGSVGCPDLFSAAFALAVETDDELLRHMGHVDRADQSPTAPALDSPSISSTTQDTLLLAPGPHKRAFISTPDIWVLEDPSPTFDEECCKDEVDNMSTTSCPSTPELSLGQSLVETSEQPSSTDSIEPQVEVAHSEGAHSAVDTVPKKVTQTSFLPARPPRKPRRAQQKKNPALLQAWSSDAAGYRNLDQTSIQSWVPALQRVLASHPDTSPRLKRPWRKWARATPGPSKSAALEVNKLAARRSRKSKKDWISQRERMGDCLRRLIEERLAEIVQLEAEVVQLKAAIACCHQCAGKYRTSRNAPEECVRRLPNADVYTGPPKAESGFEWVQIKPSGW